MKKRAQEIAEQIRVLVDQLVLMSGSRPSAEKPSKQTKSPRTKKGASGALSILIEEGFLDSPRDISVVMSKLQEMGRYYSKPLVSMNLLNLTKPPRRILTRFKDSKTKKWQYVIRK